MSVTSPSSPGRGRLAPRDLAVARHLLVGGPATRTDVGEDLRLSEASMSRVARKLMHAGLVSEEPNPEPQSTIGRPSRILHPVAAARHIVGVKLTSDTAYGVVCDLLGSVTATGKAQLPAPVDGVIPVRPTVTAVAGLVRRLARQAPTLDGVGISVGGLVTPREVADGTFLGWHHVPLAELLEARLDLPVVVTNDVTALAREQLWFGAGRTHSTFGLVTVGTGLGFGVVREGHVVEHLIDNGHLLSHTPIDGAGGPPCDSGHRGCAAAYLYPENVRRRLTTSSGSTASQLALEPAAVLDQPSVRDDAARALAHVVASFAGALQTDRIVVAGEAGGALHANPVFTETLDDRLRDETGNPRLALDVSTEPSTFTDWARGAAVVGIQLVLGALPH